MAVHGSKSLRTNFHNLPVDLPPPPNASNLSEHSLNDLLFTLDFKNILSFMIVYVNVLAQLSLTQYT